MGKQAGTQERWDGKAPRESSLPRQDKVDQFLGVVDQRLHETTPALTVRTEMGAGRFQIPVSKAGESVFQGVSVADGWIQHVHPPGRQVELTKKRGHNGHRVNGGTDVVFYLGIEEWLRPQPASDGCAGLVQGDLEARPPESDRSGKAVRAGSNHNRIGFHASSQNFPLRADGTWNHPTAKVIRGDFMRAPEGMSQRQQVQTDAAAGRGLPERLIPGRCDDHHVTTP
jgi:hypothetical protein